MGVTAQPIPGIFEVSSGVVGGAAAVAFVLPVLSDVAFAVVKDFDAVALAHAVGEEAGVGVAKGGGKDAVAVFEAVAELADVFVAVLVEGGSVSGLETLLPVANVSAGLAKERANA